MTDDLRADGGLPQQEPEVEGTPESVPTKTPDAELELTDDGIEMPEFLRGYVGEFTMRTPNVTGELETSVAGLPDKERADTLFAVMPDAGEYHGDLEAGMVAFSTDGVAETVYRVVDSRSDSE